MNWDRLILKFVIALVAIFVITMIRVLIRAVSQRGRNKGYSVSLPPPPKPVAGPAAQDPTTPFATDAARPSTPKSGSKQAALIGVAGVYKGSVIPLEEAPIIIGRDPAVSNLVFPDEHRTISARHCSIKLTNGRFYIEDCYSTNGTYLVSGKSLAPGKPVELKPGERFTIGDRKNIFEVAFR